MLKSPVPIKHHKSRRWILKSARSFLRRIKAIKTVVKIARRKTMSQEVRPLPLRGRTKRPIQPHRIPASKIRSLEKKDFVFIC